MTYVHTYTADFYTRVTYVYQVRPRGERCKCKYFLSLVCLQFIHQLGDTYIKGVPIIPINFQFYFGAFSTEELEKKETMYSQIYTCKHVC